MRKVILGTLAVLALSISANAETVRETTTTTYSGTVSEMLPSSSTIVLRSDPASQPTKYIFNDRTVWVDPAGNTVTMDSVRNQPVTVYYQREGDQMVVTRVVTQNPAPAPAVIERRTTTTQTQRVVPPPVVERKTTTTTTEVAD
jgi:hypothetical protein